MTQLKSRRCQSVNYAQESKAILDPKRRQIVEWRESGKNFREIGEALGISRAYAHALYTHAIRRMQLSSDPLASLSQRSRNCLAGHGLETREQVIAAIAKGLLNPNRTQRYGAKMHAEICHWAGLRNDGKVVSPRPE